MRKSHLDLSPEIHQKIAQAAKTARTRKRGRPPYTPQEAYLRSLGITATESFLAQVEEARRVQVGLCWICGNPETILHRQTGKVCQLSMDHDHTTKEFRALLCRRCNRVLGSVGNDPKLLREMASYLENFK